MKILLKQSIVASTNVDTFNDILGKDYIILVENFSSSGYSDDSIYVRLVGQTNKQWVVQVIPTDIVDSGEPELSEWILEHDYTQHVYKDKLIPITDSRNEYIITELL